MQCDTRSLAPWVWLCFICKTNDVINADIIKLGEAYEQIDWDLSRATFITAVYFTSTAEVVRDFFLRFVVIDTQIF